MIKTPERIQPPEVGGERAMLDGWLEFHRATLAMKCAGLTDEQLRTRAIEPSNLSLIGLLRHLTEVENGWFSFIFAGRPEIDLYCTDEDPDGDFNDIAEATGDDAFDHWTEACDLARRLTAGRDLDEIGTRPGNGERPDEESSLRWIILHMIEEYARHNGHADLLRERIDGVVGD